MYGSMLYDVHITLLASSGIERAGCLPIRFSFSEDSQGEVALLTVCTFGSHAVNLLRKSFALCAVRIIESAGEWPGQVGACLIRRKQT
jgi:hypothetical protein